MSVSTDAIDWPTPIHGCSRAHRLARGCSRNRPWSKYDAGPYNAAVAVQALFAILELTHIGQAGKGRLRSCASPDEQDTHQKAYAFPHLGSAAATPVATCRSVTRLVDY